MLSILVEVRHGETTIDQRERPLRRLPDQQIGVLYQGVVYPLIAQRYIDVSSRWFYPSDCPVLLEVPSEWRGDANAEGTCWHLDTSGYYSYVFVNGSDAVHTAAKQALETAGFRISRTGRSFREADDGANYDWFLRLEVEGERRPSGWEIDQALSGLKGQIEEKQTERRVVAGIEELEVRGKRQSRAIQEQVVERPSLVASAEGQLAEREHEVASLRSALEQDRAVHERERGLLREQMALLRGAIGEYSRRLDRLNSSDAPAAEEVKHLNERLLALQDERREESRAAEALAEDLEKAIDEWDRASREATNAKAVVETLNGQIEDLQAALTAIQRTTARETEARSRSASKRSRLVDLEVTIEALLPEMRLIAGSLDFIAHEVFDRRNLFTVLRQLSHDPGDMQSKRVQGGGRWLERHFNTGQSNDGRIYYRKLKDSTATAYDVLISDKHNQPRDLQRLKAV